MATLTHLCLNRLEDEPYLHRIIPYLTNFQQDHPGQKLIVLSDKELLTKGLYLSLKENNIPVQCFGKYQSLPFNLLNGSTEDVIQRFQRLGLLEATMPRNGTEALFHQTSYLALTHALKILKTVKGNFATIQDLTGFLSRPTYQKQAHQLLQRFRQMPVANTWEQQQHMEAFNWFAEDYFPSLTKQTSTSTFEYSALGRLNLEQFEQEWLQLFPKQGVEHRLDLWQIPDVVIIDVHHLKQIKPAIISYLVELVSQQPLKHRPIHLFSDLSEPLSEEDWSERLLNHSLEVTQTHHHPKELVSMDTLYEMRSIKYLQYYTISNKDALLQAIHRFKTPEQLAYEKQQQMITIRREELLRKASQPPATEKPIQHPNVTEDWIDFSDE